MSASDKLSYQEFPECETDGANVAPDPPDEVLSLDESPAPSNSNGNSNGSAIERDSRINLQVNPPLSQGRGPDGRSFLERSRSRSPDTASPRAAAGADRSRNRSNSESDESPAENDSRPSGERGRSYLENMIGSTLGNIFGLAQFPVPESRQQNAPPRTSHVTIQMHISPVRVSAPIFPAARMSRTTAASAEAEGATTTAGAAPGSSRTESQGGPGQALPPLVVDILSGIFPFVANPGAAASTAAPESRTGNSTRTPVFINVFSQNPVASGENPFIYAFSPLSGSSARANQGFNPFLSLFSDLLGGSEASGDYVFSQRRFDEIMSQLMEQYANKDRPPPASDDAILKLPLRTITESDVEEHEECAICTDAFELGATVQDLPCRHIFHPECITSWLKINGTCPICRYSFTQTKEQSPPTNLNSDNAAKSSTL